MTFSLTVLGCSSAIPTSTRNPSAHLLNVNERFYLIDCGEATQIQLRKFKIKFQRIEHIFITHLHGDHFYGLIGLITTMQLLGREKPLNIYSPPGLEEIILIQLNLAKPKLDFTLSFHELNSEENKICFEDEHISVETIPLNHRIPCCGFLFREKPKPLSIISEVIKKYEIPIESIHKIKSGEDFITKTGERINNSELTIPAPAIRTFAYCADTLYNESIIPMIKDADLLYHEATFMHDMLERAGNTFHTTTLQAAEIAKIAQVKQLIIGHFSARYKDLEPLLEEARAVFPDTFLAEQGKEYAVEQELLAK